MIGDKRKFPIMLVVPNMDNLKAWATRKNLAFADEASLIELPRRADKMEREVKKELRDLAHFEMPKKVMLLSRDFSIEGGRADADAQGQAAESWSGTIRARSRRSIRSRAAVPTTSSGAAC